MADSSGNAPSLFDAERNGKFYPEKRVRVVYVLEREVAVVVTVYVYDGRWEAR